MKKVALVVGVLLVGYLAFGFFGIQYLFIDIEAQDEMVQSIDMENIEIISEGEFFDVDHSGVTGSAKLVQDGEDYKLLFEGFRVDNGPDLFVYGVDSLNVSTSGDVKESKYVNLGRLKGNIGDQAYEVNSEDLENIQSVVIWCRRFGVNFAAAVLD